MIDQLTTVSTKDSLLSRNMIQRFVIIYSELSAEIKHDK